MLNPRRTFSQSARLRTLRNHESHAHLNQRNLGGPSVPFVPYSLPGKYRLVKSRSSSAGHPEGLPSTRSVLASRIELRADVELRSRVGVNCAFVPSAEQGGSHCLKLEKR